MATAVKHLVLDRVKPVRRYVALLLTGFLVACGTSVPRPSEENLRAQIDVLLNRASLNETSWSKPVVRQQLKSSLPKGRAVTAGWMLEWEPQDGGLAYVIVPWEMLKVEDPQVKGDLPYGGGQEASKGDAKAIKEVVISGLDPSFRYLVSVHSIRVSGNFAAFFLSTLLPVADDAYGFAEKVDGSWEVRDLGSAEVGCGLVPKSVLKEFKVRCAS